MGLIFQNSFNLAPQGEEVARCGMVVGVELNDTVIWIGKDLESADLSFKYNDNVKETIFCESVDKSTVGELSMSLDPFNIIGAGDTSTGNTLADFQAQLLEAVMSKDLSGMVAPAVVAFGFAGANGAYRAKRYAESTWKPQSIGGSGVDKVLKFPVNVTFAGKEDVGTVDKLPPKDLTATFTVTA